MSEGRSRSRVGRGRVAGAATTAVAIVGLSIGAGSAAAQIPGVDLGGTADKVSSPVEEATSSPNLPSTPSTPTPVRLPGTPSLPTSPAAPTVGDTTSGSGSGGQASITGGGGAGTGGGGSGAGTGGGAGSSQPPPGSVVLPASGVAATNAPGFTPASGAFLLAGPPAPLSAASNLMVPFPMVVLEGTFTPRGVHVRRMRITASNAIVSVRCRRRCPSGMRGQRAVAARPLSMRRFQRRYRAGAVLQIRVMRRGKIGKYVRFAVRRAQPPSRLDLCTNGLASRPIRCPV